MDNTPHQTCDDPVGPTFDPKPSLALAISPPPHPVACGCCAELVKALPDRWQSQYFAVQQLEATSADGERIPYFLVAPKNLSYTQAAPVLLYGYGGFERKVTPWYSATYGRLLLDRGGCLAVANIRGGGEFGPAWHQVEPLLLAFLVFQIPVGVPRTQGDATSV